MSEGEQRHLSRDSLFVMADLRLDVTEELHRIKVRNLSSGGMMAEGLVAVQRGTLLFVEVRNVGWVEGSVAWVQGGRFGIAFRDEIDLATARTPVSAPAHQPPRHVRMDDESVRGQFRKI